MNELPDTESHRFVVDPTESGILIEARSTAGTITFGTNSLTGYLDATQFDGSLLVSPLPRAQLTVDLRTLRSGNSLYDAELAQRLEVRRYPEAVITLSDAKPAGDRFQVTGRIDLHGQSGTISGSVSAEPLEEGWMISGQQVFDIRDFEISVPSVLMLRIFPDVVVYLTLKLTPDTSPGRPAGR